VNRVKLSPANVVILAAGVLILIGSFLAFYKVSVAGSGSASVNAWDRGQFMIATLPALLGSFMALQVGLVAFGHIDMPNRLLGLTWDQVHLVLSLQAALLMLSFLTRTRFSATFDTFRIETTLGVGFWLMLVAAIGLVVGAFMRIAATGRRPRAI
jgi:hypothetical protein